MHGDRPLAELGNNLPSSILRTPNSTDTNMLFASNKVNLLDPKQPNKATLYLSNHVFHSVPSQREVQDAVSALQKFIQPLSSSSRLQQISGSYDPRVVMPQGYKRLYDALQLLQADPAIMRLVVSLSSDKAFWDAVLSNVLHQKLLELPDSVRCRRPQISEQNEFGWSWILEIIKGKISELIESFQSLMNDLFQSPNMENAAASAAELDEKVRSSFLLSIVILLVVVMARSQKL
ncbi:hypothetical protein RJT34_16265 [Clitoria ternatea]|uniref:Uncharacterized protein n=1 Tax=Clitoria ternatea TaxID=43366 RepID=A0AAN9J6V9_CLITE